MTKGTRVIDPKPSGRYKRDSYLGGKGGEEEAEMGRESNGRQSSRGYGARKGKCPPASVDRLGVVWRGVNGPAVRFCGGPDWRDGYQWSRRRFRQDGGGKDISHGSRLADEKRAEKSK